MNQSPSYNQPLLASPIKATTLTTNNDKAAMKKLSYVLALACTFMAVQIAGAVYSNSIAIFSDVAHILADILGFSIAISSLWLSGIGANKNFTYGYHRAGIIGALASVMAIWVPTVFLIYYSVKRIININTVVIDGKVMFGTACFGLMANLIMMRILRWEPVNKKGVRAELDHIEIQAEIRENGKPEQSAKIVITRDNTEIEYQDNSGKETTYPSPEKDDYIPENVNVNALSFADVSIETDQTHSQTQTQTQAQTRPAKNSSYLSTGRNLSIRSTLLHILGDIMQSIGIMIGSIMVWLDPVNLKLADPIITLIISLIVLYTTIRVARDCVNALMEATPLDLDSEEFEKEFTNSEGVINVHDFHVWILGEGKIAMTAHIFTSMNPQTVLKKVTEVCKKYEIYHSTVQVEVVEDPDHPNYVDCKHELH